MIITHLLFDMDNTLYPESSAIDKNMTKRIIFFVARFFNCTLDDAAKKRQDGLTRFGTTLEWLLTEHNLTNTKEYFSFLHPEEEKNEVAYDPLLRPFLLDLKRSYHLTILTNAPKIHADCILHHLRVSDIFDKVYDLEDNKFLGKPHREAYEMAILEQGFKIENTLFFDDHLKYIKGFSDIGGKGVIVDQMNKYTEEELQKANAFAKICTIYEIPSLLKKIIKD